MNLPSPGHGRPEHDSYREVGPSATIAELLVLVVGLPAAYYAVNFIVDVIVKVIA